MSTKISRRDFLKSTAAGAVSVAAMGFLGACASETDATSAPETMVETTLAPVQAEVEEGKPARVTEELPIVETYEADRPEQTEYEVDVLVVGGGYAGCNAAYSAKQAGQNVMLLDKGRPGYSGQSPWPGTFNYFDPDMGDDADAYREYIRYSSEFLGNLDWIDIFMNESKAMKERIASWGNLDMYDQMFKTEYWETRDYHGYRDNVVGDHERRTKFVKMLDDNEIPWLQHVMVNNLIVQDGKCVGAIGFQFTTGEIITVHAKAVVLATGNGAIIPTGHPVGDNTFDGEYMAYNLGLPISGKEFEDFHTHQSFAPGNNWIGSDSRFFDPNFLCGGNVVKDGESRYTAKGKYDTCMAKKPKSYIYANGLPYLDTQTWSMEAPKTGMAQAVNYGTNPDELRMGKMITPYITFDAPGGAAGMCLHLASGVFCGNDDTEGYTGIPGLWVAGDGIQATCPDGGNYDVGNGFTSCFCSICGDHAGKAAAAYAATVELERISDENYEKAVEEIEAPLKLDTGFSPMWARDVLQGIMAPYWVMNSKSEATLKAALAQVEYMQEHVAPKLLARSGHSLRMCHEVKHKINACMLKLNASLTRTESRGANFFREDYPERNDEEWLKYILQTKGEDGKPVVSFVPVKEEWTAAGTPAGYFDED